MEISISALGHQLTLRQTFCVKAAHQEYNHSIVSLRCIAADAKLNQLSVRAEFSLGNVPASLCYTLPPRGIGQVEELNIPNCPLPTVRALRAKLQTTLSTSLLCQSTSILHPAFQTISLPAAAVYFHGQGVDLTALVCSRPHSMPRQSGLPLLIQHNTPLVCWADHARMSNYSNNRSAALRLGLGSCDRLGRAMREQASSVAYAFRGVANGDTADVADHKHSLSEALHPIIEEALCAQTDHWIRRVWTETHVWRPSSMRVENANLPPRDSSFWVDWRHATKTLDYLNANSGELVANLRQRLCENAAIDAKHAYGNASVTGLETLTSLRVEKHSSSKGLSGTRVLFSTLRQSTSTDRLLRLSLNFSSIRLAGEEHGPPWTDLVDALLAPPLDPSFRYDVTFHDVVVEADVELLTDAEQLFEIPLPLIRRPECWLAMTHRASFKSLGLNFSRASLNCTSLDEQGTRIVTALCGEFVHSLKTVPTEAVSAATWDALANGVLDASLTLARASATRCIETSHAHDNEKLLEPQSAMRTCEWHESEVGRRCQRLAWQWLPLEICGVVLFIGVIMLIRPRCIARWTRRYATLAEEAGSSRQETESMTSSTELSMVSHETGEEVSPLSVAQRPVDAGSAVEMSGNAKLLRSGRFEISAHMASFLYRRRRVIFWSGEFSFLLIILAFVHFLKKPHSISSLGALDNVPTRSIRFQQSMSAMLAVNQNSLLKAGEPRHSPTDEVAREFARKVFLPSVPDRSIPAFDRDIDPREVASQFILELLFTWNRNRNISTTTNKNGEDILSSPEALREICEAENHILHQPNYDRFCLDSALLQPLSTMATLVPSRKTQGPSGRQCSPPLSLASLFYIDWDDGELVRAGQALYHACAMGLANLVETASLKRGDLYAICSNVTSCARRLPDERAASLIRLVERIRVVFTSIFDGMESIAQATQTLETPSDQSARVSSLRIVRASLGRITSAAVNLTAGESKLQQPRGSYAGLVALAASYSLAIAEATVDPFSQTTLASWTTFHRSTELRRLRALSSQLSSTLSATKHLICGVLTRAVEDLSPLVMQTTIDELRVWGVAVSAPPPPFASKSASFDKSSSPPVGHGRSCILLNANYVRSRAAELYDLVWRVPSLRSTLGLLLPVTVLGRGAHNSSERVRSIFMPGYPYSWPRRPPYIHEGTGFFSGTYEPDDQLQNVAIKDLLDECAVPQADAWGTRLSTPCVKSHLQVVPLSMKMFQSEMANLVRASLPLAAFSVVAMALYLWLRTRSLLFSLCGMTLIISSLGLTWLLDPLPFAKEEALVCFLLIGVGVDDIVVFSCALQFEEQNGTAENSPADTSLDARRRKNFHEAYVRSAPIIFATTLTTGIAFLTMAFLSDVYSIAAFGVFATIAVTILYILTITWWPTALLAISEICCKCRKVASNTQRENRWETLLIASYCRMLSWKSDSNRAHVRSAPVAAMLAGVVIAFSTWKAVAVLQVEIAKGADLLLFPVGHAYRNLTSLTSGFLGATDFTTGSLYCGIYGIDSTGFSKFEPYGFKGVALFAPHFDFDSARAQEGFLRLCDVLDADTSGAIVAGSVQCFLKKFRDEIGTMENTSAYSREIDLIQWARGKPQLSAERQGLGLVDGRVRYVRIDFNLALPLADPFTTAAAATRKARDATDSVLAGVLSSLPRSLAPETCFIRAAGAEPVGAFAISELGDNLFHLVISNIACCASATLCVLFALTRHFVLSLLPSITVTLVCVTMFGSYGQSSQARIGFSVVLISILAVGYTVDYSIHLVQTYSSSTSQGRQAKVLDALARHGPVMIASGTTTCLSGIFMSMCPSPVFSQIGSLVVMLVLSSCAYTMAFLAPMLMLVGPE